MIETFHIENFKSYLSATLKLSPLTVLIGANASGKSNALEAIRLLSWIAQGQKLSSLQFRVNQEAQIVRGQTKDLAHHGSDLFSIGCQLDDPQHPLLSLQLGYRPGDGLHIASEECRDATDANPTHFFYRTLEPTQGSNTDIRVSYNNFAKGGNKPQLTCNDQQGIFTQLGNASRFAEGHEKAKNVIPSIAKALEAQLSKIVFLDPLPSAMRDYSFLDERNLHENGSNLSTVLYYLWQQGGEMQQQLLAFIKSLPEQDIQRIDFLRGPRSEVMLQLIETFGQEERAIEASLLSDGTLRVLAIAAALLWAQAGSLVIIEEIDNGVHPNRAHQLLTSIYQVATQRQLRVLLSSHNPALLDALPIEAIPHVVFCYRDPQDGSSKLSSLQDLPDYPELIAQGTLGALVTEGTLERFVKQYPGADQKKQQALAWLSSIQSLPDAQ